MDSFLQLPLLILENMNVLWTFVLLIIRYTAVLTFLPGIGGGMQGITIRMSAILVLAYVSLIGGQTAELPPDFFIGVGQAASEFLLGFAISFVPMMLVAGAQTAGMLSSMTMGLGAAQLLDPTFGANINSLAKIFGDLVVAIFLLLGGHHLVIYAVAGLGGELVPGSFVFGEHSTRYLIDRSADIFRVGVMISAPVLVALLLTQFGMGLISKAVPTVNIFIVSFPLTIGIGLILSSLSLPEMMVFFDHQFASIERGILTILRDAVLLPG